MGSLSSAESSDKRHMEEPELIRAKPPRPTLAISKKMVFSGIALVGIVITVALFLGNKPKEIKAVTSTELKGSPSYSITSLPSSYADMPPPRPVRSPQLQAPALPQADSELQKLLEQLKSERLKRAIEARRSSVNFLAVSISDKSKSGDSSANIKMENNSPSSSQKSPRDDANRQDDKREFLESEKGASAKLHQRLISPASSYELQAGTVIPGLLLTGLNSDLPGQILGQTTQNIFDSVTGRHLLLPQGTKVVGSYDSRIVYGQERALIVWSRLILPNGRSISLEGMPGVDLSGYAGLSDQVNNHYLKLLSGVVFSSLLGAGAQLADGPTYQTTNPEYSQLAVQGVARNANEVGQEITRRNLNIQPTIEIRPGYRFNIFVSKDITLEIFDEE